MKYHIRLSEVLRYMAEIIEKMTPEKFVDRFSELMMDQRVHNILVRGYFDDDKVLLTFGILNDLPHYKNGTLVIGNTRVQDEKNFLERGLRKTLPRFNLRDIFKIYGLNIQFTQWKKNRDFRFNDNKDFAIFHPVQTAISDILMVSLDWVMKSVLTYWFCHL